MTVNQNSKSNSFKTIFLALGK